MRFAAIQYGPATTDLALNRAGATNLLRAAAEAGAELAVLPELAVTPYFCAGEPAAFRPWSEPADGDLVAGFAAECRALSIGLALPFYECAPDGRFHNSAVVIGPDGRRLVGRGLRGPVPVVRKLHLPCRPDLDPASDEPAHFAPGDDLGVFDLGPLRLGCLVCYDRRFPECWRALRALGADAVAVVVAGSGGDDAAFFLGELRTHAKENGVAVVCASKAGEEHVAGGVVRNTGESCIVEADGCIIAHRPLADGAGLVVADIAPERIHEARRRIPFFEQRRRGLLEWPA